MDSALPDLRIQSASGEYRVRFPRRLTELLSGTLTDADVFIADRRVLDAHGQRLAPLISGRWLITIEATEHQKSYSGIGPLIQHLIEGGFRRGNRLVALGGGITQDVTGFIASLLYRGVDWLFVPTTLLAQGDSCIGSKTSINVGDFKNQLGGFHPPRAVFIDCDFLESLPRRDLLSGLGEMAHYFPIAGADAFSRFAEDLPRILCGEAGALQLIGESLRIKQRYVEVDEFDRNERQIFNYGHTFGHALESVTGYTVPHGIAVSYGIDLANKVSVELGFLSDSIRTTIRQPLRQIWTESPLPSIDVDRYKGALARDKKNRGSELGLILTKGWGDMFKHYVRLDARLESVILEFLAEVHHA